jgi:hypothetical protein
MSDERKHSLCIANGCSGKIAELHATQIKRGWHPHPPKEFRDWWTQQPDYRQGIDTKRAYNCQRYRDQFLEAKQYGAA